MESDNEALRQRGQTRVIGASPNPVLALVSPAKGGEGPRAKTRPNLGHGFCSIAVPGKKIRAFLAIQA